MHCKKTSDSFKIKSTGCASVVAAVTILPLILFGYLNLMSIPLLTGGEPASALLLNGNALIGELESKMTQMLSGKSFLLGQRGLQGAQLDPMPSHLMGRCFFFTKLVYSNGSVYYAPLAPEYIADGTDARNYSQTQFTDTITNDVVVLDYDETNKVANIERIDASLYNGLPKWLDTGFFEHCLFPAYVLYQGAGDAEPVKYYLREAAEASGGGFPLHPAPEKYLRFGLAEFIIESDSFDGSGFTNELTFAEEEYELPLEEGGGDDIRIGKFGCYRIHNLQAQECTVTFRNPPDPNDPEAVTDLEVELAPFECKTVRRNEEGVYAETGWHYFFPYKGATTFPDGDPRFYFYLPATTSDENPNITATYASSAHPRAANSMAANNLTNISLVFDWVTFFDDDKLPYFRGNGTTGEEHRKANYNPRFIRDLTAEGADPDLLSFYQGVLTDPADPTGPKLDLFGDPTNPETKLGDLLFHKGWIHIVRRHKTAIDPETGEALITRDKVFFRGFDTIVEDFAAHQLLVEDRYDPLAVPEVLGGLWVDNADPDNDVDLIPIGTNLFHSYLEPDDGDGFETYCTPTLVQLPRRLTTSVFCYGIGDSTGKVDFGGIFLNDNAANVVQRWTPAGTDAFASRFWNELQSDGAWVNQEEVASERIPNSFYDYRATTWYTTDGEHGIHQWTVADLLNLTPWGEASYHPDQSNAAVTFSAGTLHLSWEGWVIKFTETRIGEGASSVVVGQLDGRQFTSDVNRRVYFRGHGWPYLDVHPAGGSTYGGVTTGFYSPRYGRYTTTVDYGAEIVGAAGADFTVSTLNVTETEIRQLRRVEPPRDGRQSDLWLTTPDARFWHARFMDNFLLYLEQGQTDAGYWEIRPYLLAGPKETPVDFDTTSATMPCMALLPEMYNAMAGMINSVTKCLPLNALSLRWVFQDPDEVTGVGKTYYLPEIGHLDGGGWAFAASQGRPVPMEEYTQVVADSDFEELCERVLCPIKDAGDLPEIGPLVDGNPDPSPLDVTKFSKMKGTVEITLSGSVQADGGSSTGFSWQGSATITQTVTEETEAWYAARDAATLQLARGKAVFHGTEGISEWETVDLKTDYEDYRWVTITDVAQVFAQYGIPVIASQMCSPLRLINQGEDTSFPSARDYTESYVRDTSTRTGIVIECNSGASVTGYPETAFTDPDQFTPNGINQLRLRSGYWFGPAKGAYDADPGDPEADPPIEPEPVALWKHYGTAYEPGDKMMASVPTWWGGINQPSNVLTQPDAWSRLTAFAHFAGYAGNLDTISFQPVEVMGTAETADWPGMNPASWVGGWVYHFLTWPAAFPDAIISDRWGLMRCVNCANEVTLVKDHYWTALPDIQSEADYFKNHYGDLEPIFTASLGCLGTIPVPHNESRTIRPVAVSDGVEQPFTGYMLFDPKNAFVTLT